MLVCASLMLPCISTRMTPFQGHPDTPHPPAEPSPAQPTASSPDPTFDGDDVLPDLVLQLRLVHLLQQLVNGVDVRVDRLEPLYLGSDGGRVGQMLLVVHGWKYKMGPPLPPGDVLVTGRAVGYKSEICDLQQAERSREKASDRAFSRGSLGAKQFDAIKRKAFKKKSPGGKSPEAKIS